jgi:hypothetical protein
MSRLDFFLASEDILSLTSRAEIFPKYKSDHSPVCIQLTVSTHARGKGNWKCNNSLLKDEHFVKLIKPNILNIKMQYASHSNKPEYVKSVSNEHIKLGISDQLFFKRCFYNSEVKSFPTLQKKKRDAKLFEEKLQTDIANIEYEIQTNPTSFNINIDTWEKVNLGLEHLCNKKSEGTIVRSRAQWYEQGEQSSKYFCNLENKNYVNKTIQKLELDDVR